jgi:dTDP-4-dehydrorhamnose reductase
MILLLGASGYIGNAFQKLFLSAKISYQPLSRINTNNYHIDWVAKAIKEYKATFLINAAGYTGNPNVDACELNKNDCLEANAFLPARLRILCEDASIPWGHISSGCIFQGRRSDGRGFFENDEPNFTFKTKNCSFYSGTKALGEEILKDAEKCFIWRLRIPFDHRNSPRNYLSKLLNYDCLLDAENSISHLGDFVSSCIASWKNQHPYGIYNLTNPGAVTTRDVVEILKAHLVPDKKFHFFSNEDEFLKLAVKAPRSNCVLDTTKSEEAGIAMRPVHQALLDAVYKWQK